MAEWKFNSDEKSALQGLSLEAKAVYLLEIRTKMDFNTGVAGEGGEKRNVVSYEAWRESLEFFPDRSSTKRRKTYTKDALRAIKNELVRSGLIEQIGNNRFQNMIFRLPLASLKQVRSKYEPHMNPMMEPHVEPHREPHGESYKNHNVKSYEPHQEPHVEPQTKFPMNPIPQVSGNTISLSGENGQHLSAGDRMNLKLYWASFHTACKNLRRPVSQNDGKVKTLFAIACRNNEPKTIIDGMNAYNEAWAIASKKKLRPDFKLGAARFLELEVYLEPSSHIHTALTEADLETKGVYHDDRQAGTKKRVRFSEGMADAEKECQRYWEQQNGVAN